MSSTLFVLALVALTLMIAALVAAQLERRLQATWLLMVAFIFATAWAGLNVIWARSNPSMLSPELWLTMATMAAAAAVYYFYLGMDGHGIGD